MLVNRKGKMENPQKKPRILVCCTGSVATIKLNQLLTNLLQCELEVRVVATEHAQHFFKADDIPTDVELFRDADEWSLWQKRGDPVLHIDLGKWADVLLIAPLDANSLAKISQVCCHAYCFNQNNNLTSLAVSTNLIFSIISGNL